MRELLRKYTTAVQAEWDSQGSDAASGTARAAITDMYRVLGKQQPPTVASNPINVEVRDQLNVLTSQRNTRVLDAKPRIPGLLWGGLLFGGVLLIGLIGFTRLDDRRNHMIVSSAIAVLLGLLLCAVGRGCELHTDRVLLVGGELLPVVECPTHRSASRYRIIGVACRMRRYFDAGNIAKGVCKRLQRELFADSAIGGGRLLKLIPKALFGSRIGRTRFATAPRGHGGDHQNDQHDDAHCASQAR